MPQWRKLHVKTTESLDVNDMPDDFTRLLWVMLPLGLDREGRGLDNPAWVKAKTMPLRTDVTPTMVEEAMNWYASRGMIERYEVGGRRYFWLVTFARYQGKTDREAPSEYPPPPDCLDTEVESKSGVGHDQVMSGSSTDSDVDTDSDTDSTPTEAKTPASAKKETPPAVKVFRSAAHRYPAKSWYADIDRRVGRAPPDLDFWHEVVKTYVGLGWNPTNVVNMLEFFERRQIPSRGDKNGGKHARPVTGELDDQSRQISEAFASRARGSPGGT